MLGVRTERGSSAGEESVGLYSEDASKDANVERGPGSLRVCHPIKFEFNFRGENLPTLK